MLLVPGALRVRVVAVVVHQAVWEFLAVRVVAVVALARVAGLLGFRLGELWITAAALF